MVWKILELPLNFNNFFGQSMDFLVFHLNKVNNIFYFANVNINLQKFKKMLLFQPVYKFFRILKLVLTVFLTFVQMCRLSKDTLFLNSFYQVFFLLWDYLCTGCLKINNFNKINIYFSSCLQLWDKICVPSSFMTFSFCIFHF